MKKFPRNCSYCLVSPCQCHKTNKLSALNIKSYAIDDNRKSFFNTYKNQRDVKNLKNFISNITTIYPHNEIIWKYSGPWHHFYKMSEELAEIHEAYSQYEVSKKSDKNVSDEIADVFAWILSAWHITFPNDDFDDEFINYYKNGCQVCTSNPCICKSRSERAAELVNADKLLQLKESVDKLIKDTPESNINFEEVIKSIDSAIKTQDLIITKQAAQETKTTMAKFKSGLTHAKDISKDLKTVFTDIDKIQNLLESFLK